MSIQASVPSQLSRRIEEAFFSGSRIQGGESRQLPFKAGNRCQQMGVQSGLRLFLISMLQSDGAAKLSLGT